MDALLYDKIYKSKNYSAESEALHRHIQAAFAGASTLLDVACGTGRHLEFLGRHYRAEGLDLDQDLLVGAKERCPEMEFYQADMRKFNLGKGFDAITCLFSAIGYLPSVGELEQTLRTLSSHLNPGGVLLIERWIYPEDWQESHVGAAFVDEPDLKIARMHVSKREGRVSVMHFHYMIATPGGVEESDDVDKLYLFSHEEYMSAFEKAGLQVSYEPGFGRGLYLGKKGERE
jgi:SAM-dependent methyltransferase